jgi:hypothetical protein
LIDPDDCEGYALGKLHKKTLQPLPRFIHQFDIKKFFQDWSNNNINDRSFKNVKGEEFNAESHNDGVDSGVIGSILRHGTYAYSSKDWDTIKEKIADEKKIY